jgi:hypothetical protein
LVTFHALPKARSEEVRKYGGAYVNCWVEDTVATDALATAKHHVSCSGWKISGNPKTKLVTREEYKSDKKLKRYFDEAAKIGLCTVIHTYPRRESKKK